MKLTNYALAGSVFAIMALTACGQPDLGLKKPTSDADQSPKLLSEKGLRSQGCVFFKSDTMRLICQPTYSEIERYQQVVEIVRYLSQSESLLKNPPSSTNTFLALGEKSIATRRSALNFRMLDFTSAMNRNSSAGKIALIEAQIYRVLREIAVEDQILVAVASRPMALHIISRNYLARAVSRIQVIENNLNVLKSKSAFDFREKATLKGLEEMLGQIRSAMSAAIVDGEH